jgi:hypothetical protein
MATLQNRLSSTGDMSAEKILQIGDQLLELRHGLLVNAVANAGPVDFTLDETRLFENLQVLRDGRLCQGHLVHYLSTQTCLALKKQQHDADSCRMGQSPTQAGQVLSPGYFWQKHLRTTVTTLLGIFLGSGHK